MKHRKWFLTKFIYDTISQEMKEVVTLKEKFPTVIVRIGEHEETLSIVKVKLPVVTTPIIGQYDLSLTLRYDDGEEVDITYPADDFDEKTILRIAMSVYCALWTSAYKTFDEYMAWEEEKYRNIF